MKSDKLLLPLLLLGILCFMLFWALFVINGTVGLHPALNTIGGSGKFQIESLGQFGASFGVLAALFAGFAVVMLGYSIRVQQKELTQLKEQMENDRDRANFTWLVDAFQGARNRLKIEDPRNAALNILNSSNGKTDYIRYIISDQYIQYEAEKFMDERRHGTFANKDDLAFFKDIHQVFNQGNPIRYALLQTYHSSVKQIATFIKDSHEDKKILYLKMFASVTNKSDLIVIHEYALLHDDYELIELLKSTGLLGVHGIGLYDEMSGGPRLDRSAFGIK